MAYTDVTNTSIVGMAGVHKAQWSLIDSDGYPMGPTGSIANGSNRGMGIHPGIKRGGGAGTEPRIVNSTGDDGLHLMQFAFGPAEIARMDMLYATYNMDFYVAATGTKIHSDGEWNTVLEDTNADINSTQMCIILNILAQEADADFGKQRWTNLFYPILTSVPLFATHEEAAAADWAWRGIPSRSAKYPWGVAWTKATNGATRATKFRRTSRLPMTMHTFIGDGATTTFTLDYSPASDDTGFVVKVYKEGTELTKTTQFTVNPGLKRVTLATAPTAGQRVVVVYEAFDLFG